MTIEEFGAFRAVARELAPLAPLEIRLHPADVFHLSGLIQLALRNPAIVGVIFVSGAEFLSTARAYFADCPAVLEMLRSNEDPSEDS